MQIGKNNFQGDNNTCNSTTNITISPNLIILVIVIAILTILCIKGIIPVDSFLDKIKL